MEGLAASLDKFITFNEYKILEGKGTRSSKQAIAKAEKEYEQFNMTQKVESYFDKVVKKLK